MDKTKVVLVNPFHYYFEGRFKKRARYFEQPMGLAYVAGYLLKHNPGVDVEILCANELGYDLDEALEQVLKKDPHIVGVTAVTLNAVWAKEFCRKVKEARPDLLTVVGGPHPTALPEDFFPYADISVIGEGEQTMLELCEAIESGGELCALFRGQYAVLG